MQHPHKLPSGFKRLPKALACSIAGLKYGWQEAAFRLEFLGLVISLSLGILKQLPLSSLLILLLAWLWVLVIELLNSALEVCIDYISLDIHPLAKQAKDLAAGAVMLSLIGTMSISCYYLIFQV